MPGMPGMAGAARRASKSARKKTRKKGPRSGDPRRAGERASGGGQQDQAVNGPGQAPGLGNLGGLGGLPEGISEDLAEQLSKMPSGLSFPPQGPQGNIPAAFRGGGSKRKKK